MLVVCHCYRENDEVIKTNEKSLSEIGKDFGKATADISANAYQGFVETWDKTVK